MLSSSCSYISLEVNKATRSLVINVGADPVQYSAFESKADKRKACRPADSESVCV